MAAIVMDGAPWWLDVIALAFVWLLVLLLGLCLCMAASEDEDEPAGPAAPVIELGPRQRAEAARARRMKRHGLTPMRADQRGVRRDRVR